MELQSFSAQILLEWKIAQVARGISTGSTSNNVEVKWIRPPPQFLKCNIDAALFQHSPYIKYGSLLRNAKGEMVMGKAGRFQGILDPFVA